MLSWPPTSQVTSLYLSLLRKTSKFEDYGKKNKNRAEMAPWRTKLFKEFLSLKVKNPIKLLFEKTELGSFS